MTNIINDSRINYDNYILILSLFYIYEMFLGENEDFLEEMQSPMVQNILETGVDRNIVMQKIKRRARERGI